MKLTIEKYGFTVTVEGPDSGGVGDIAYYMDSLCPKPVVLANIREQANTLFDQELAKMKAKTPVKRGRGCPVGSRNKK